MIITINKTSEKPLKSPLIAPSERKDIKFYISRVPSCLPIDKPMIQKKDIKYFSSRNAGLTYKENRRFIFSLHNSYKKIGLA